MAVIISTARVEASCGFSNSDPRQQAAEDGPAATFGEARGDFRRRFLTPHSIGLNDEAFLPWPGSCGERGLLCGEQRASPERWGGRLLTVFSPRSAGVAS